MIINYIGSFLGTMAIFFMVGFSVNIVSKLFEVWKCNRLER